VQEADDITKSSTTARETKGGGGGWRLEVKDDRRKLVGGLNARLGRTTDWVGERKNMTESIKWGRKIEE
jgi:hypothetical protein